MEVHHELDYNQSSLVAEACVEHFKIRNKIGRVTIGDIQGVHDEGIDMWKTILSQQKKAEEEIQKEVKQGQDIAAQEKRKGKDKDTTDEFDAFIVEDIIGDVVSDIPNLTKDAEPLVEQKSTIKTIDINNTPAKGTDQTKHSGEDEVTIVDIPYEEKPQRNPVTINIPTTHPTSNEPHLPKKGLEQENPKMIDSSILFVDETKEKEQEKKEVEKKIERKETKSTGIGLGETKELKQEKKIEDFSSGQLEGGQKTVVDTPPVKRKLVLEKETEKKKAKLPTSSNSEVEAEVEEQEIEEEEGEDSVIDIKKMTPK
ncbi:uncharacterized protein LOC131858827 [Cryptomeria japonica]|uniref:uncharacterized protein LOC131858827 n=1 Tax=Cryptomeria japonica TaxID=3369 RepID=UPI0027DA40F7|nr:uncharacterized protein LOC131858827 [Cryptomeria japonica]